VDHRRLRQRERSELRVSETVWSSRHEPTCYVYDDSLWVVAGNHWPVQNDVWRLTLPAEQAKP